ncbi:MAG: hypothetical protein NVS1B2_24320 [Vulcanimicrobiaceae bacterium]
MTGSLALAAAVRHDRTRLARVCYDGNARCSRAFEDGPAARVVTSMLGPGFVAGDVLTISGDVAEGARLVVADQSATRAYGGHATSMARSIWRVAAHGTLALLREPTTLFADSRHQTHTAIDLASDARAIVVECVTIAEHAFASFASRLEIRCDGARVVCDRARLETSTFPARTLGTCVAIGHLSASAIEAIERTIDVARGVRCGLGRPLGDGVVVRAYGDDAWSVRETLHAIAAIATTSSVTPRAAP